MKKRFLSMLLTGLMIMLLLPAGAFAAEPNVPVLSGGHWRNWRLRKRS